MVAGFWKGVACLRPDSLLSLVAAVQVWVYVCWTTVIFCWGLLGLLYLRPEVDMVRSKQILRLSTSLLTDYFAISVATGLLLPWFEDDRFGTGFPMAIKPWSAYISLPIYLSFLLLRVLTLASTLEFDLYYKDKFRSSEITQDLLSSALTQLTLFSYFLLSPSNYPLHLCVVLLFSTIVTLRHVQHLPYYDYVHNALFIWSRGSLAASALAQLIGYLLDSEECGFVVMIALTLSLFCIIMLSFPDFQTQKSEYFAKRLREQTSAYTQELGLRHWLISAYFSTDKAEALLSAQLAIDYLNGFLSVCRKTDLARLMLIKHLVLRHAFENERAARMCLSQTEDLPASLYDRFLLIKSEWLISNLNSLEEIQFLKYLERLQRIHTKDEEVCRGMTEVWNELGSSRPDFTRVITLSKRIRTGIAALKAEFQKIIRTFPGNFEIYDLYASFQQEVLSRTEDAKPLSAKAAGYQKELSKGQKRDDLSSVGFFDSSTAVILVDLRPNTFSDIIYMNSIALDMLEYDLKSIQLLKLSSLIPQPYSKGHTKLLRTFVQEAAGVNLSHPVQIPFLASNGFVHFCLSKLLFTSYDGQPLLAIACKPVSAMQSGAVLTSDLRIEAHTETFAKCIGALEVDIRGKLLTDIRPSIARVRAPSGISPCFQLFQNRPFYAIFTAENYSMQRVYFIFTFESEKDCSKWDVMVSDVRSSLFVSSNLGSDQKGNAFFLSEYSPEVEEKLPSSPFNEDLKGKYSSSMRESSTTDSHSREKTLLSLNKSLSEGSKACSLIAIITVRFTQIAALLVLNITVSQVISRQVSTINSVDTVVKVSAKQVFVAQLAYSARIMSIPQVSVETRNLFNASLATFRTSLQELQAGIWSEIEESKSRTYEEFYIRAEVVTWELLAGEVVSRRRTLVDAVQKLLDEVSAIQSELLARGNQTLPAASVFYVYRNGLGETYDALHQAKLIFLETAKTNISQAIDLYFIYILMVFASAGVATILTFPVLRKLQSTANATSQLLYLCEIATYYEEKQRAIDRLSARYEVDLDPAIEHPMRGRKQPKRIYHPGRLVVLGWGVLWTLLICFYFPFYFVVLDDLAFQMKQNPQILAADSTRTVSVIESDIWASEIYLASRGILYAEIVPEYSICPDPGWMITPLLSKIAAANKELLQLTTESFNVRPQHFDFLYRSTGFPSRYFLSGYRPGIKTFLNDIIFCSRNPLECGSIVISLYQTSIDLATNVYLISEMYQDDCTELSTEKAVAISYMLNCFAVGLVLGLGVFLAGVRVGVYSTGKALLKLAATMGVSRGKERTVKETAIDLTKDISM